MCPASIIYDCEKDCYECCCPEPCITTSAHEECLCCSCVASFEIDCSDEGREFCEAGGGQYTEYYDEDYFDEFGRPYCYAASCEKHYKVHDGPCTPEELADGAICNGFGIGGDLGTARCGSIIEIPRNSADLPPEIDNTHEDNPLP
tara:strand:- start:224 stop:661 length:438 start_codon:yes stop_codon:yes gene_type:complete